MAKGIFAITVEAELNEFPEDVLTQELARCRMMLGRAPNSHHRKYYEGRIHLLEKLIARKAE